jgi:hypothetical protein
MTTQRLIEICREEDIDLQKSVLALVGRTPSA